MAAAPATEEAIKFIHFSPGSCHHQLQCPLFSVIPAEIRDRIFSYTLAEYEDESNPYDHETCYRRPDYLAPRHSDTALLRTCQRVYIEAWFRPWTSAEHTLWLTWAVRCPRRVTTVAKIQSSLTLLYGFHGDIQLDHVRVFAQLCNLDQLSCILDLQNFHPRCMTIAFRHTDWWDWEFDDPLRIEGGWVDRCRFPESLRELRIELESLERKKEQVDSVAAQMIEKWQFQRRDGVLMSAKDSPVAIMRWSGSSTWEGQRWIRDETRPDTLEYYVCTVAYRPSKVHGVAADQNIANGSPASLDLFTLPGAQVFTWPASLRVTDLRAANVQPGASAQDALMRLAQWETEQTE